MREFASLHVFLVPLGTHEWFKKVGPDPRADNLAECVGRR
jgi:hypothetical protein